MPDTEPSLGYGSLVYVDETDEAALGKALPHVLEALSLFSEAAKRASQENTPKLFQGRGESGAAELARLLLDAAYPLERNPIFIAAPETVAAKIDAAAQEGVFDKPLCEMNFGSPVQPGCVRSIRLMGESGTPKLRTVDPTERDLQNVDIALREGVETSGRTVIFTRTGRPDPTGRTRRDDRERPRSRVHPYRNNGRE